MESTATWIPIIAFVVSVGSLLWQVGLYRLEGPRLKVSPAFAQWTTSDGEWTRSATISVKNHGRHGALLESVVLVRPENFGSPRRAGGGWHGGDPTVLSSLSARRAGVSRLLQTGPVWLIFNARSKSDAPRWPVRSACEPWLGGVGAATESRCGDRLSLVEDAPGGVGSGGRLLSLSGCCGVVRGTPRPSPARRQVKGSRPCALRFARCLSLGALLGLIVAAAASAAPPPSDGVVDLLTAANAEIVGPSRERAHPRGRRRGRRERRRARGRAGGLARGRPGRTAARGLGVGACRANAAGRRRSGRPRPAGARPHRRGGTLRRARAVLGGGGRGRQRRRRRRTSWSAPPERTTTAASAPGRPT